MEELEYLEKELEKQESLLQGKVFKFIKNTSITDIVEWSVYAGDYDISIVRDNITIKIAVELLDDEKGNYYGYKIGVRKDDKNVFYMSFLDDDCNEIEHDGIPVIKEKISQVKALEYEKIKKEQDKEKQERIKYCLEEITKYQVLNQLFD